MGAVDVAFTEATVGAGVSTVVLIATIFNLKKKGKGFNEACSVHSCAFDWAVTRLGGQGFSIWGDPHALASSSPVSSHFIASTGVDTEVPNMVTAVLADYRGFDTMFETVVVFIAGLAVISILRGGPTRRTRDREFVVDFEPDLIVTNTVRLIVPVIQIFAFYVARSWACQSWGWISGRSGDGC